MFDVNLRARFDAVFVELFLLGEKSLRRCLRWREQHAGAVLGFFRGTKGTQLVREPGGCRFSARRQSGQLKNRDLKPAELLSFSANFDDLLLQRELARQAIKANRAFRPPRGLPELPLRNCASAGGGLRPFAAPLLSSLPIGLGPCFGFQPF